MSYGMKIRYVFPKVGPTQLTKADKERIEKMRTVDRFPGFGQAPAHPTSISARIGLEYTDKYRGDKK